MTRSNSRSNIVSIGTEAANQSFASVIGFQVDDEEQATGPVRLLIIDDDPADRALVNTLVDANRYATIDAKSGIQGLELAAKHHIDCVLLDSSLPDLSSTEMFHRLRNITNDACLPVILFTGQKDESDSVEAIEEEASDFLPKNRINRSSLARVLFNSIKHAGLTRSLHEERKRILAMNRELRRANYEIGSFYQTVSHELKTPLMAIREFTSLTLDEIGGPITQQQREYLTRSLNGCDRLASMINDLMDTACIETGKLSLELTEQAINPLIENCTVELAGRAREAGIEIDAKLAAQLPMVSCDELRMGQVINNLITNAIKFTPSGGTIVVKSWLENSSQIAISVADTGRGIDPQFHTAIFDRFAQARAEDADFHKGMGIGLYLCASIVENHGGSIEVASELGCGSTFTFKLPV